jgi:hypothetical protein
VFRSFFRQCPSYCRNDKTIEFSWIEVISLNPDCQPERPGHLSLSSTSFSTVSPMKLNSSLKGTFSVFSSRTEKIPDSSQGVERNSLIQTALIFLRLEINFFASQFVLTT